MKHLQYFLRIECRIYYVLLEFDFRQIRGGSTLVIKQLCKENEIVNENTYKCRCFFPDLRYLYENALNLHLKTIFEQNKFLPFVTEEADT